MDELSDTQIADILAHSRLGVLSMAEGDRSYAIPIFFGSDGHDIYFHCHPGYKDRFFDATSEACLVVTHVSDEDLWESIQVFGRLRRLSVNTDIDRAKDVLYHLPPPPVDGAYPSGKPMRSEHSVYYAQLDPTRISGRASTWKVVQQAHKA